MPRTILTLILTAVVCALGATSASAASPDPWRAGGPSAKLVYDGTRGDAVMQYALAGNSGAWTMQATAGSARKLSVFWNYQGYHAWFGVKVSIEKFVIRGGTEIVTETLRSANASRCCEAPSGGFEYEDYTRFDVQPGDVYGFRMTGSNADSDRRLNGTLTLDVLDITQLTVTPKVKGTLGVGGWYTSDVEVHWDITYPANYPLKSVCFPKYVRADTAGQTFGCNLRLPGGDTISESVTIKRDTTPPVVTISGPDAVGTDAIRFRRYEVSTYQINVSDALSGLLQRYGSAVPHCTAKSESGASFQVQISSSIFPDRGTGSCMTMDAAGNLAQAPIKIV